MNRHLTRSRILAVAALAFAGGVVFASSMDWTRLVGAQARSGGKPAVTEAQPLAEAQGGFVAVAERVTPAVVAIDAQRDGRRVTPQPRQQQRPQLPPGFEQFFQFDDPQSRDQEQTGSGFIVTRDGYVLTNNHVIEGADRVKVILTDRREFRARIVGRDPQTDVAVLKIDGSNLPTVSLGDDTRARVGEWAIAIGNPLGLDFTVTAGIISAKGRSRLGLRQSSYAIQDFIQTDAAINPGNSGGPLVNLRGEVIGINSAIASGTGFYSGYGFAIPITLAKTVMDDLIAHGSVRRAIMGAGIDEVNAEDAAVNKLKEIAGVKIMAFNPPDDSPAEKAGLEPGDIVLKIDGKPVDRVSALQRQIRAHQPGDVIELDVVRYGERKTFRVKLGKAPTEEQLVASSARDRNDENTGSAAVTMKKLGISIEPLTAEVVRANRIPESAQGVRVSAVEFGGPAEGRLGPNDIITEVRFPEPKTPVRSPGDLQRILGKLRDGDIVSLMVSRAVPGQPNRTTAVVNLRVGG
ncbi:MAG TPA: Do family serine endopeptidase [Gemmatimonadaceae bacterium]|nr:Do family serine endopeptidase [Gemmatimonadaceae bacterium]